MMSDRWDASAWPGYRHLTESDSILLHRKMWAWISMETLRRKEKVTEADAFLFFKWPSVIHHNNWCCEYGSQNNVFGYLCCDCPIIGPEYDICLGGLYDVWKSLPKHSFIKAAYIAARISRLPTRKADAISYAGKGIKYYYEF